MNIVTLIADNGGGFTLQVVNGDDKYQHYYECVTEQVADDVLSAMDGDDTLDWDGNSATDGWLEPTQNEINNGGFNSIEADCYHTVLEWGVGTAWSNVDRFTDFFADLVNK